MNTSLLLGIGSIALTAVACIIGTWLTIKYRTKPAKITFYRESCIGLFDSIVRNIPELSVTYKDEPVSEQIVLLKGYLINMGSKDIKPDMVEKPLSATLPDGYRWLEAKITDSSPNIKVDVRISEINKLEFNIGLLRPNEYILLELLVKVPSNENNNLRSDDVLSASNKLIYKLIFNHRIADTGQIEHLSLDLDKNIPTGMGLTLLKEKLRFHGMLFVSLMFFTFAILWLIYGICTIDRTGESKLYYEIGLGSGETVTVKIKPRSDGTIEIKGVDNDYQETSTIDVFFSRRDIHPKIVDYSKTPIIIVFIIFFAIFTFLGIKSLSDYRKERKMVNIIFPKH